MQAAVMWQESSVHSDLAQKFGSSSGLCGKTALLLLLSLGTLECPTRLRHMQVLAAAASPRAFAK
jgi:hypothetical protein